MEAWDVYDSQGNPTGKVTERGGAFLEGEYHLAASLWIINQNKEILIQKRSQQKKRSPGKWSITGGAAKAGENSRQACVREVAEEIGLNLRESDITLIYRTIGKDFIFDDYAIIHDFPMNEAVLQAEEVSEIKWVSAEEIKELFDSGQFAFVDINDFDKVIAFINDNFTCCNKRHAEGPP